MFPLRGRAGDSFRLSAVGVAAPSVAECDRGDRAPVSGLQDGLACRVAYPRGHVGVVLAVDDQRSRAREHVARGNGEAGRVSGVHGDRDAVERDRSTQRERDGAGVRRASYPVTLPVGVGDGSTLLGVYRRLLDDRAGGCRRGRQAAGTPAEGDGGRSDDDCHVGHRVELSANVHIKIIPFIYDYVNIQELKKRPLITAKRADKTV